MYPYVFDSDEEEKDIETKNMESARLPGGFNPPPNVNKPDFFPKPGGHPGGFPPSRPDSHNKPTGRPPSFIPPERNTVTAVDPRTIRRCLNHYSYIWLENGRSFWMYPTQIGRKSISGYRWSRYGWTYIGFDLDLIASFYCMP